MYAEIILSQRFPKHLGIFDYKIPKNLEKIIAVGQLVAIPFRSSDREGVVVKIKKTGIAGKKIKEINSITNEEPILTPEQIQLAEWMNQYYFVSIGTVIKAMLPPIPKRASKKMVTKEQPPENKPANNPAVKKAVSSILSSKKKILLFTPASIRQSELFYRQIISKATGTLLIIVPEISAISHINSLVQKNKQSHVVTMHSQQNKTDACRAWQSVSKDSKAIVIGTKSALFAPFNNLKLVIIDQEENQNHKQADQNPRYDSRNVAIELAGFNKAKLIYSSHAPTLNAIANAEFMRQTEKPQPVITLADMRDERKSGNYHIFSEKLSDAIKLTLQTNKSVFLFINKRGTSSAVICRDCGYIVPCPKCGQTLAYHENSKTLFCHGCNTKAELPPFCPKCGGANIKMAGIGTQTIESEISKNWPKYSAIRYDSDAADQNTLFDAQIIIGTARAIPLVKWEDVGLVGIVSADNLLHLPDFRASERTWQILNQFTYVSSAPIILQTHSPDNPAIKYFVSNKPERFYKHELEDRIALDYPPAGKLIKLVYQNKDKATALRESQRLNKKLKSTTLQVSLATPLKTIMHGKWQMYIIIKYFRETPHKVVASVLQNIPDNWIIDRDPESLL